MGQHEYDKGTVVDLAATAASGWRFKNWSGGKSGTNPATTITMSGNKSVTANFIQRHTVTTASHTQGIITPASGTWDHGQSVSFKWEKEAAISFYQFTHWSGLPDSFTTTEWGLFSGRISVGKQGPSRILSIFGNVLVRANRGLYGGVAIEIEFRC